MTTPETEPLRVTVQIQTDPAAVCRHFTRGFGSWWPLATHSVGQSNATDCGMEPYPGGKIWERTADGTQHLWGHMLQCDEPEALSFTWHPGRPIETAQTIDVRFVVQVSDSTEEGPPSTRVVLEHGDWHVFGPAAEHAREQYREGWKMVLDRLRRSAEADSNPGPR